MRCVIEKEQFIKGLTMVSKAIPQKAELPILSNVKLELCEKGLVLTGSDNNIVIATVVPYMIDEKEIIRNAQFGETLVQCKLVLEVVRHMEDEYITLELVDNSILKIEDSKANFKLNSIRADEYPQIDLTVANGFIEVKANDIKDLVDQTSFAASMKETRPILTAINLDAEGGKLTATATDTARLARKSVAIDSDAHFVANIPAKKMIDIVRSFENEEYVNVAISDNKAIFKFGRTTISTRLINGEYPNTKHIVPKVFNYFLEVNSREFLASMERVSLLSADHDGVIKLILDEDEAEMISRSSLVGSANEKLSMFKFSGEHLEISFRASFVADAIRANKSEDVTIAFIGEMKPFVVRNDKDDSIDMLVTPLRA